MLRHITRRFCSVTPVNASSQSNSHINTQLLGEINKSLTSIRRHNAMSNYFGTGIALAAGGIVWYNLRNGGSFEFKTAISDNNQSQQSLNQVANERL